MKQNYLKLFFNSHKNIIVVGIISLAAVIFLFKEFNMYQKELKRVKYKLEEIKAKKELLSEIKRKKTKLQNIEGKLLPESLLGFKQTVEHLARLFGVDIISLRPVEQKKKNPYYRQIGLDLRLGASYGGLSKFIKSLEKISVEIKNIFIRRSRRTGALEIRLYIVGIMKKGNL